MYTRDTQRQYQRKHYTQLDQRQKGQVTLKNEHQWQRVKASVQNTACFSSITRRRVRLLCSHETQRQHQNTTCSFNSVNSRKVRLLCTHETYWYNANTRTLPAASTRPISRKEVTLYTRDIQRQYQNTTYFFNSRKARLLCTHETYNANTRTLPASSIAERSGYSVHTRHTDATPIPEHYLLLQLDQR